MTESKALAAHFSTYQAKLDQATAGRDRCVREIEKQCLDELNKRRAELQTLLEAHGPKQDAAYIEANAILNAPECAKLVAALDTECKKHKLRSEHSSDHSNEYLGKYDWEYEREDKNWVKPAAVETLEEQIWPFVRQRMDFLSAFHKKHGYEYELRGKLKTLEQTIKSRQAVVDKLLPKQREYEADIRRCSQRLEEQSLALKLLQLEVEPADDTETLVQVPLAQMRAVLKLLKL
ncbi:Hypothetical protein POVN_LOCUS289 [uncultured virus]|nr:Hypothetical protein POVN_LOCUS289 [uncultured virus]